MSKRRVLFLCNANSARSLMGEALLRHMAGDRFESFSAGSEPDEPHALTLDALRKQGLPTEGLRSKSLDEFESETFDFVIVLCDKAQQACRDWQGQAGEVLFWDIRDPRLIGKPDAYEQALLEIRRRLQLWLPLHKSA
ncbi:arsenate reductase ArsC [Halomonas sp. HAL1]|uniref:arsenate reductase ArsC n=1 Tax=Halomonas sp. HAL1 TaxID=550984 RepID=UPI0001BB1E79|nr:arsenate reductase ArsC [Halomonas sp. HAL1]ACF77042.1 putative low molecular weight phosphotyrosine protein [Halomonas sp. HAL1]WKV91657.1 arsenate reductase ArsC [Halomonas sp. HAL1]